MKRFIRLVGFLPFCAGLNAAAQSSNAYNLVESDVCVLGATPAGIAAYSLRRVSGM